MRSTVAVVPEQRIAEHTVMQLLHRSLGQRIAGSIGCNTVCTNRYLLQPVGQQLVVARQQFDLHTEQHIGEQSLQDSLEQSVVAHTVQSYLEIDHNQPQQH